MQEILSCTIFLLFFFFAATTTTGVRRRLHQPVFLPPEPPQRPPPLHSNPKSSPFFPLDSPPTPPTLPTFPADVSDPLPNHHHPSPHLLLLIPALLLLLLLLLVAAAATAVFLHRRRRRLTSPDDSKSESRCLFPPDAAASDGRTVPVGTFESSRRVDRKLGSPELRPLPPLPPRLFRRGSRRDDYEGEGEEEEEEFDSPRWSSAEKESSGLISSASRRGFPAIEASSSSASRSPAVLGTIKSPTLSSFSRSRASASPAWLSSDSSIMSPPTYSPTMPTLNRAPPAVGFWEGQVRHVAPAVTMATDEDAAEVTTAKPKLKPLHWEKVMACSDQAMAWDHMESSSFRLNEKKMEALFVCNATSTQNGVFKKPGIPSSKEDTRVLDPKKSQSIAILLRALNVTKEEVCEALLEGNMDNLSVELLETLVKMAPTQEEEIQLKAYHDNSPVELGPAERFLKAVIDIPFAFKRIDAMLYIANFDYEVKYLERSFEALENACEELRSSRMFRKLLEAVLKTGNRMNVGTIPAPAFKLDTLLKLVDIRGPGGETTLLHFVVQEIIQLEGSRIASSIVDSEEFRKIGLQVVAGLSKELGNVKKAAGMDSNVLGGYVLKLAGGIGKIREVLRLNESTTTQGSSLKFCQSMSDFLNKAEEEIVRIQAHQSIALSLVKEMIVYFHGDFSKEEAHLFRLFMVVRDFLDILDGVCREVGIINQKTTISSARELTVPVHPIPIDPSSFAWLCSESGQFRQ